MEITFDPAKSERNLREHGISFEQVEYFGFDTAVFDEDMRVDYGENRIQALGFIGSRLHLLVFTMRESGLRVISLRKANQREVNVYEKRTRY